MRAVVLRTHGGPEVLAIEEVPDPSPGPPEGIVGVAATALNRADLLQRRGLYPGPPMAVEIPGMEYAGTIAAVGERVERWSVGDAVMGIVGGGAYAEQIAVDERQVMAVPEAVGLPDAAAIPAAFLTPFHALLVPGGLPRTRSRLRNTRKDAETSQETGAGQERQQQPGCSGLSIVVTGLVGRH